MAYFQSFRRATVVYSRADGSAYLSVTAPLEVPPAGAFFGLPSEYFTTEYWKNRIGSELAFVIERADYEWWNLGLSFHFCFANDSAEIKNAVIQQNKFNLNKLIAYLQKVQAEHGSPEFAINKVLTTPSILDFVGYNGRIEKRDVSASVGAALSRFYVENNRLPDKVFDEYNGDPRLPAPIFERDEYGVKCPTWAALSFFSHPNSASVVFTDNGPRFLNDYEYLRFQAAFWQSVTGLMVSLKRTQSDYGGNYVHFERPAILAPFFNDGAGLINPEYVPPIPREFAKKVADFYSAALINANEKAHLAATRGQLFEFISKLGLIFSVPSLISASGSLFAGEVTYSNVLSAVKLADKIGIIEADKILAVTNLGDAVYGLSQSAIDAFNPATFTESAELDDAISIDYTPPVIEGTDMDEFDWDAWLDGQTQLEIDAGWGDFIYDEIGAFDWSSVDWGSVTEYEFTPIDLGEFGSSVEWESLEVDAQELAANLPEMTVDQLAVVNNLDEASRLEASNVIAQAEQVAASTGGNFLDILKTVTANVTGAAGAFLTLYTTYKKAEQVIKSTSGQTPTRPTLTTRPTTPGQTVRQPDGSVSTMQPDGSIRTVRPNGSVLITPATSTMPNLNGIFSKQNLLIGGAALSVGALVYLATSKRGK